MDIFLSSTFLLFRVLPFQAFPEQGIERGNKMGKYSYLEPGVKIAVPGY